MARQVGRSRTSCCSPTGAFSPARFEWHMLSHSCWVCSTRRPGLALAGARNEKDCLYKCRVELIHPDCVDPYSRVYILLGSNVVFLVLTSFAPLLILLIARLLLQLILSGDAPAATTQQLQEAGASGISSFSSQVSENSGVNGGNEYSSLMAMHGGLDSGKPSFARQLRKLVGVSSPRATESSESLLEANLTAGASLFVCVCVRVDARMRVRPKAHKPVRARANFTNMSHHQV